MAPLGSPWSIYADNQAQAARCGRLTGRSWGIEKGLTGLLRDIETNRIPADQQDLQNSVGRSIATGSWNERNRARLRRRFLEQEPEPHAERRMIARLRLRDVRSSLTTVEWAILVAVATGLTYAEIALRTPATTAGSVRTQVSRLRTRLRRTSEPAGVPAGGGLKR
jgi:hypothetical protein